jgi:hypothetical protein
MIQSMLQNNSLFVVIDPDTSFFMIFEKNLKGQFFDPNNPSAYEVAHIVPNAAINDLADKTNQTMADLENKIINKTPSCFFIDLNIAENKKDDDGIFIGLRVREKFPNTPIYIVTGKTSDTYFDNMSRASLHDFDGVLIKSYIEGTEFDKPRFLELLELGIKKRNNTLKSLYIPVYKKQSEKNSEMANDSQAINDEIINFCSGSNGLYEDFKNFLDFQKNSTGTIWMNSLCLKAGFEYNNISFFNNSYWGFTTAFFDIYFSEKGANKFVVINDENAKSVKFDDVTKEWQISIKLLRTFYKKYPISATNLEAIDNNNIKRLIRLFLLHEALHKVHNIDDFSVQGVGNFTRIIEEADYQADTFVIISDFFYWFSKTDKEKLTPNLIITEFENIIYIALNTTLAFSGSSIHNSIQVRRFNRYTIWMFVLALLNKLRTTQSINTWQSALSTILDILSFKPILDIYGIQIFLAPDTSEFNTAKQIGDPPNLIQYNLRDVNPNILKATYYYKNHIDRKTSSTEDFQALIDGIKYSNIDYFKTFVKSLASVIKEFPI